MYVRWEPPQLRCVCYYISLTKWNGFSANHPPLETLHLPITIFRFNWFKSFGCVQDNNFVQINYVHHQKTNWRFYLITEIHVTITPAHLHFDLILVRARERHENGSLFIKPAAFQHLSKTMPESISSNDDEDDDAVATVVVVAAAKKNENHLLK